MNPTQVANALDALEVTRSIPITGVPTSTSPRSIDFGSAGIIMTPEEFDAVTEYDGCYRYELIHGVLVVNPLPSLNEVDPNDELGSLLREYKRRHPLGAALDLTAPERHIPGTDSRRRADRVIWCGLGRLPVEPADVPAIAIEFVSQSRRDWTRDYIEKKKEYCDAGVKEYWIIDRFRRCMTVYQNSADSQIEVVINEDDVYKTDFLPGFELPLKPIIEMANQFPPKADP